MRVLMIHGFYQQLGGEDLSFVAECDLLERHGHEVIRFTVDNRSLDRSWPTTNAVRTVWNPRTWSEIRWLVRARRPHVMHCTNTFPLLSPACYWAAASEGVPVVQSLRNYRLICPAATLHRDGEECTECVGRPFAWPGVRYGCYRDSRAATATIAFSTFVHGTIGTWDRVRVFFTPTRFARERFLEAGFDPGRLFVKSNFLDPDPGPGDGREGGAIFVGRLAPEKGIETLLDAWRKMEDPVPLKVVGRGPLEGKVVRAAARDRRIRYLGFLPPDRVLDLVGAAACLVMPSIWYETFGRTVMEGFARGTPVVASDLGAMAELVDHGRTGLLFPPGDPAALGNAVRSIVDDPALAARLREAARGTYLERFTGDANYPILMDLYENAIDPPTTEGPSGRHDRERGR